MLVTGCAFFGALVGKEPRRPKVTIEDVAFQRITTKELDLKLKLKVFNPNDFDIKLYRANYTVKVGDDVFATGKTEEQVTATRETHTFMNVPISIRLDVSQKILSESLATRQAPQAQFLIKAYFEGPFGDLAVDVNEKKRLF